MEKVFYKKSFKAKLILNREFSLVAYQAIKDTLSQHKDVKEKGSFDHELIYAFDKAVGMIRVGRKNVILYFAIDPSKVASKYKVIDCSTIKTYAKYPSLHLLEPASLRRGQIFRRAAQKIVAPADVQHGAGTPQSGFQVVGDHHHCHALFFVE